MTGLPPTPLPFPKTTIRSGGSYADDMAVKTIGDVTGARKHEARLPHSTPCVGERLVYARPQSNVIGLARLIGPLQQKRLSEHRVEDRPT